MEQTNPNSDSPPPETEQLAEIEETDSFHASRLQRFKRWYKQHKKKSIPLTALVVLLVVAVLPWTRYPTLGLFMKKDFKVKVLDSVTHNPVSGASIGLGSLIAQTDGNGEALIKSKVGPRTFLVSKKYYTDGQLNTTVPILSQKNTPTVDLVATGRQVKVSVINSISKKPLSNVEIKVAEILAKTDSYGNASIVLPPDGTEQKATLSLDGYNTSEVKLKISDQKVEENKFSLTPSGKIYFLSKRTGKIDIMKGNLDGSEQAVVLAGTGKEDQSDTILLASRDWKYLAFKSKRDGDKAKIYWIDTSVDKLNILDEGDAGFTMIGWAGSSFIYKVHRNSVANWQPNREALKSFNAPAAKLAVLNQTGGIGTDANNYAYENYDSSQYIIDNTIVFSKSWQRYSTDPNLMVGKQAGIYSIGADGNNFKSLKTYTYDAASYYYFSSYLYEPQSIYYGLYTNSGQKYLKYENATITEDASLKDAYERFANSYYPTYLLSPSGQKTFWVEPRDGKHSVMLADSAGKNKKEIAKLSDDYQNYGFYSDDYIFVAKKGSELYIMPSSGVKVEADLIKITDYHKPAYIFYGYGGGYGGL